MELIRITCEMPDGTFDLDADIYVSTELDPPSWKDTAEIYRPSTAILLTVDAYDSAVSWVDSAAYWPAIPVPIGDALSWTNKEAVAGWFPMAASFQADALTPDDGVDIKLGGVEDIPVMASSGYLMLLTDMVTYFAQGLVAVHDNTLSSMWNDGVDHFGSQVPLQVDAYDSLSGLSDTVGFLRRGWFGVEDTLSLTDDARYSLPNMVVKAGDALSFADSAQLVTSPEYTATTPSKTITLKSVSVQTQVQTDKVEPVVFINNRVFRV